MARPASDVTTVRPGGNTRPGLRAPGAPGVKMLISSLALALTLAPGAYTGIVRGKGGGMGVGLVEVFKVDP